MSIRPSRRQFMAGVSLLAAAPATDPLAWAADRQPVGIAELRTNYASASLAVETPAPLLSWRLIGSRRGLRQAAYRLLVASSPMLLRAGHADLWDSGRVVSDQCFDVAYQGKHLPSRQICHWQVEIWDDQGTHAISEPAMWQMGLLAAQDWRADWIEAEDAAMRADRQVGLVWVTGSDVGERQFRRSFETAHAGRITLIAIGSGPLQISLDGQVLALPAHNPLAFGGAPAATIVLPLDAGSHMLMASVGLVHSFMPVPHAHHPQFAAFIKLEQPGHAPVRLSTKDWQTRAGNADWQAAIPGSRTNMPWPPQAAVLLRRDFTISKPIVQARLYVTALGAYDAYLNGGKIGRAVLAPESTDFSKRALYRAHDVTALLRPGANTLGAMVGDGWFASYTASAGRFAYAPPPRRLLAQLEISHPDGSTTRIGTDAAWRVASGPVTMAEIYNGEDYDARLEQPGWNAPGFDAAQWQPAAIGQKPSIVLSAQNSPPIRAVAQLRATMISNPRPGVFVFDFGQNFAGWAQLRVKGDAGQQVKLRFAEVIHPGGDIDQSNLRAARAADFYTLRGDPAGELYQPHFTYHGFRYVQVTGYPGTPGVDDVIGIVAHSDLTETGHLHTDNALINQLWQNALWSQRSNFFGLPTDCPQRDERLGWMGDANVFWSAAAFNMDVDGFTRRFMDTVRDAQSPEGGFSDVSPNSIGHWGTGAAPGWADAGVILPWTAWHQYGDTGIIEANWAAMDRYLGMIEHLNPDLIWRNGREADFGDWLSLDGKQPGDPTTPKDLLSTAVWSHSINCMIDMATATGRKADAARLSQLWQRQQKAFNDAFVRPDGTLGNGSQTGYILALRYDLLPASLRDAALGHLVADIKRRGTLLSTGFLGTPNSLDVLADGSQDALVYDLLLRTAYPSWGHMVAAGATTMWERWNGDTGDVSMNSFNHYAFGAIISFMYRRIAGIAALAPGFREIAVAPVFDKRVNQASGSYQSVMGPITTQWQTTPQGGLALALSVPPNTTARLTLPITATQAITEAGKPLHDSLGIDVAARDRQQITLKVAAGQYRFAIA